MTESQGGTGGSTGTTDATVTGGTTMGSQGGGVTEGSNSESQTMGTTPTSTDPTTEGSTEVTTGTTGTAGGTTEGTTGTTGGMMLATCGQEQQWTLNGDFDQGTLNNVNHADPNNDQLQITLDGVSAPKPYMFVGQTSDGWLVKLDTETGKQLARYETVRLVDCPTCNASRVTWYPSRVSVDFEGDVFVANRAFSFLPSVTKIAGSESSCVDRNKNGVIDTSSDANNDGIIDVNSAIEFKGQNDECVLYTWQVGGQNMLARALALDGQGSIYVGTFSDNKAYKYDITQTPPVLVKTYTLPSRPYGFVVRGDYLYASAPGQPVMRLDLTDESVTTMNAPGNYGITVDQNGIAFFGGSGLQRCDFESGGNCEAKGGGVMSGVAIDKDGQVWSASSGTLYKFDNSGKRLGTAMVPESYGVAIGHDGHPRVIGNRAAFKVESGLKNGPPGAVTTYNTGIVGNPNVYNYTYSDFTGFGVLNVTVKKGEWTVSHDSGQDDVLWGDVLFNTEPEGKIPAGTSLTFQLRAANLQADLAATPWVVIEDNSPVEPVTGRFYELRARLLITAQDIEESPVLSDVCVTRQQ